MRLQPADASLPRLADPMNKLIDTLDEAYIRVAHHYNVGLARRQKAISTGCEKAMLAKMLR